MIYFKNEEIWDFNEITVRYGANEFKSPYCSTIPLLLLFKSGNNLCYGLTEPFLESETKYVFEHETHVRIGRGRSSCTDLMIELPNTCIGIEAKRTEPPYINVLNWLHYDNDGLNRMALC